MTDGSAMKAEIQNRLLAALSPDEYERLLPRLERVPLVFDQMLHDADTPIEHVYFVCRGVTSLVTRVSDHVSAVEVATIGCEGMVGLPVFLGTGSICLEACVQVPGQALRLRADHLREEIRRGGELVCQLLHFTHSLFAQTALVSACNRLHPVEVRCARWLLQVHDRAHSDAFHLTQKFLSQMLGVRRASITVAAGMLQQAGLIRYRRGTITIIDRQGLEEAACECYRVIRSERERVLPLSARRMEGRRERSDG